MEKIKKRASERDVTHWKNGQKSISVLELIQVDLSAAPKKVIPARAGACTQREREREKERIGPTLVC